MQRTDKDLRTHVLDELDWTPNIDAGDIGVGVSEGVVTLTGQVHSYAQKREAERAVLRVAGVRGVANDIEVRLPEDHERSDTDITKAAVRAIDWHTQLPAEKIKVKVQNGWITLQGTVNWHYQKTRAEQAVRYLTGVRGVRNELTVKNRPAPGDVRKRIRTALERRADDEANQLRISVESGEVTLKGTVPSWTDRENIEQAAWDAPGVTKVKNQLKVEGAAYAY
jgi:osmotically-inducible protein OsmY